jgi:uncharacterized protein with PIN domain
MSRRTNKVIELPDDYYEGDLPDGMLVEQSPAATPPATRCPSCGCGHAPELERRTLNIGKHARVQSKHRCRNCGRIFTRSSPA